MKNLLLVLALILLASCGQERPRVTHDPFYKGITVGRNYIQYSNGMSEVVKTNGGVLKITFPISIEPTIPVVIKAANKFVCYFGGSLNGIFLEEQCINLIPRNTNSNVYANELILTNGETVETYTTGDMVVDYKVNFFANYLILFEN